MAGAPAQAAGPSRGSAAVLHTVNMEVAPATGAPHIISLVFPHTKCNKGCLDDRLARGQAARARATSPLRTRSGQAGLDQAVKVGLYMIVAFENSY
jgi:hypothetical protein